MRRILSFLLLLCAASAFGAAGDILGVSIETNGWVADVTIASVTVSSTNFNFGFGTNNSGTSKMVLTISSPGFNADGTTTTRTRTVYGTQPLRLPYPNQTALDVSASGGNAIWRVALSDVVYPSDMATYAIQAGVLTTGGTANNAGSGTVTVNSSIPPYPKCIAHFVLEERRPVNGMQTVEVFAVQKYGMQGKPVARVEVTATGGTSGHVAAGAATVMTRSARDGWPVYAVPLNLSTGAGFTRGELVTINFRAYPWIGDATAILDASTNATYSYGLQPLYWTIMDKMIAVVDLSGGNDASGQASTTQATADAHPFATIAGALNGIAGTNNALYSLNRIDGGEVQLKAGGYNFGQYGTFTTQNGYFTLTPHSSASAATVVLTNWASGQYSYPFERLLNVTISRPSSIYLEFNDYVPQVLVLEKVRFMDPYSDWCNSLGVELEFLDCIATNTVFSGGGNAAHSRLNRNCLYTNLCNGGSVLGNPACVLGGGGDATGSGNVWNQLAIPQTNTVIGYCRWTNLSGQYFLGENQQLVNFAVVNTSVERKSSSATPIAEISSQDHFNILFWNNSWAGQRFNHENDWVTPANHNAINWSLKNNIFNSRGDHRADIRAATASLIGYWAVAYSVGCDGNWNEGIAYVGDDDFWGLNCVTPPWPLTGFGATMPAGYIADASYGGSNTGNGTYRVRSDASALTLRPADWFLPYDLDGVPRGASDPPGAYASANPRRGVAFLGQ